VVADTTICRLRVAPFTSVQNTSVVTGEGVRVLASCAAYDAGSPSGRLSFSAHCRSAQGEPAMHALTEIGVESWRRSRIMPSRGAAFGVVWTTNGAVRSGPAGPCLRPAASCSGSRRGNHLPAHQLPPTRIATSSLDIASP